MRTTSYFVIVTTLAGCVVDPEGVATTADDLRGGAPSTCYPQVVALRAGGGHQCSGTVIGPGLVITAAHCVVGEELRVVQRDGTDVPVTDVYLPPALNPCRVQFSDTTPNDVAVLRVDPSADLMPPGVPPASLPSTSPSTGETLQTIAFGPPLYDRRQGAFRVDAVSGGLVELTSTNAGVCNGDSGSPLLRTPASPTRCSGLPPPTVAGVIADWGDSNGASCALNNSIESPDLASGPLQLWLWTVVAGSATPWNQDVSACCSLDATTPPPPRSCTCASGCTGTQACQSDNTWGACECPSCDPCNGDPCCYDPWCCGDPYCGGRDECWSDWDCWAGEECCYGGCVAYGSCILE